MDNKSHLQMTEFLSKTTSDNTEDVPCLHYAKFRCIYSALKAFSKDIISVEYSFPKSYTLYAEVKMTSLKHASSIESELIRIAEKKKMIHEFDTAPNGTLNIKLIYNEGDIHNEDINI